MRGITIAILMLFSVLNVFAQQSNFKVSGRISFPCEIVYLYVSMENQMSVDSCEVSPRGDYELLVFLKDSIEYTADIIPYPLVPQKDFSLRVMPGEDILLNIDSNTFSTPLVEGSPITNEDHYRRLRTNGAWERNTYLKAILSDDSLSESDRAAYQDSLVQNEYYLNTHRWLETAEETISPDSHRIALTLLARFGDVSKETMDSLIDVMKKKFPNNERVQLYPNLNPSPPRTYESYLAVVHRNKLLGLPAPSPWKEPRKKENYDLTPLQVGDMVDTMSVESLHGARIHLKDIKSEYVLLEFWAGWCAPCIKEIPHLLEVQNKYGDNLTILAISFDRDQSEWKKAIEKNGNGSFLHGYIGNDTQQTDLFMQRFGIKGIPASFLLDKDRRIVGANFRWQALDNMMGELTDGISGK